MVTILALSVLSTALSQPEAEIQQSVDNYFNAVRTYDVKALGSLLDKDYVEVSPLGDVDERNKVLSFYQVPPDQRGPTPAEIKSDQFTIRFPAKGVCGVACRTSMILRQKDKEMKLTFRSSMMWVKRRECWKLAMQHAAALRTPPKRD